MSLAPGDAPFSKTRSGTFNFTPEDAPALDGLVAFDWNAMDAW